MLSFGWETDPAPDQDPVPVPAPDRLLQVEAKAIQKLAMREHSRHELATALGRKFPGAEALIDRVLDDLQQRGLLSDERFTEQYVGSRMRKGYGPLRIRDELKIRGVDRALIDSRVDPGDRHWAERLRLVANQRFGEDQAESRQEQAKRARFLETRGYPQGLIRRYLWD